MPRELTGRCAALGCHAAIPPDQFMCAHHWAMVPYWTRKVIEQTQRQRFRRRQFETCAAAARRYVAQIEGRR